MILKFKISKNCWKNRGLEGLKDFVYKEFENNVKSVLKSGGTGLYDIEFKKVDDLSFEETDLQIGKNS